MIAYYKQYNDSMIAYTSYGEDEDIMMFVLIDECFGASKRVAVKMKNILTKKIDGKTVKYFKEFDDNDLDGNFNTIIDINEIGVKLFNKIYK